MDEESRETQLTAEDRHLLKEIHTQYRKLEKLYAEIGNGSLTMMALGRLSESVRAAEEAIKISRTFLSCG